MPASLSVVKDINYDDSEKEDIGDKIKERYRKEAYE